MPRASSALRDCAESLDSSEGLDRAGDGAAAHAPLEGARQDKRARTETFGAALAALLRHGQRLSRAELVAALALVESVPNAEYRGGRQPVLEALRELLVAPVPARDLSGRDGAAGTSATTAASSKCSTSSARASSATAASPTCISNVRGRTRPSATHARRSRTSRTRSATPKQGQGHTRPLLLRREARVPAWERQPGLPDAPRRGRDTGGAGEASASRTREHGLEGMIERHRGLRRLFED